jgi:two-component system cell cycle response regulator
MMSSTEKYGTTTVQPTVLLVDDSRVMRKAIGNILNGEFVVIEAEDGEDGWAKLTSNPDIQVVISDIEMPNLDGFGLLQRLRNFEDVRISRMPVIIITGAEDEETRQAALDNGATDFVTKPVDRTQLLARARAQAKFTETQRDLEDTAISLKTEATRDPLTGLHSRRFFLQRGEQDIAYSRRHHQDLALLRVDIDKFRHFYSDYGDEAVDEILTWIAQSLKAHARVEDTLARIGGSSFALLAPATSPEEAMVLGERMRKALSQNTFQWQKLSIPMTASIGMVTLGRHIDANIDGLLKKAELCLRQARRSGGNRLQADAGLPLAAAGAKGSEMPSTETITRTDIESTASDIEETTGAEAAGFAAAPAEPLMPATEDIVVEQAANRADMPTNSVTPSGAPTVDEALQILATGDTRKLEPYLWALLQQFMPLLEYCNTRLDLGIGIATRVVRHKIENPDEE